MEYLKSKGYPESNIFDLPWIEIFVFTFHVFAVNNIQIFDALFDSILVTILAATKFAFSENHIIHQAIQLVWQFIWVQRPSGGRKANLFRVWNVKKKKSLWIISMEKCCQFLIDSRSKSLNFAARAQLSVCAPDHGCWPWASRQLIPQLEGNLLLAMHYWRSSLSSRISVYQIL